jgi:hypothetical protein
MDVKIIHRGETELKDVESLSRLKTAIIKKVFEKELPHSKNKTGAVYKTAANLDIYMTTVWKVLRENQ